MQVTKAVIGCCEQVILSPLRMCPLQVSKWHVHRQVELCAHKLQAGVRLQVDSRNCAMWPQLLEQVTDTEACAFIHRYAS